MLASIYLSRPATAGLGERTARAIAALGRRVAESYRRRRTHDQLMALSDTTLRDIGLSRAEVQAMVYGVAPRDRTRRHVHD